MFEASIEVMNEGAVHRDVRRDWLLFQALPLVCLEGTDPFSGLILTCLPYVSQEVLETLSDSWTPRTVLDPCWTKPRPRAFQSYGQYHCIRHRLLANIVQ